MKTHTNGFKQNIKLMGKEIDSIITYNTTTLHDELYSVSYHYEGNLLKSIMKQLDIESSVDIPINTIINYQLGLKVDDSYEYLDYGNYVVVSSEKQEDLNRYKITCYDKMVYSMKQNEDLGLTYPISLKNYLIAIGNAIGLEVENTTFANQSRMIPTELYAGLEYTYRDILDEIAQATGSNIIINSNDRLEVKYINNTNDIIDEEYLKDINVTFKDKFGPVNTIVLSRSGEADNIYYPSPLPENPIQLKIVDNQIMNRNDRDEYLPELYLKLNGIEFYINDFNSTGICYYDVCDMYNVKIGDNTYKCLMLNDEINITSGLEEIIHTDMPEQGETDYTKADKTDRRINQTYLIVDKQNQTIEAVVTNVGEQNQKIAKLTQDVDEIKSEIQDIADITISDETTTATLSMEDINESEPVRIVIHPIGINLSYLYPSIGLFPSSTTYLKVRTLRFQNTTTEEIFDYELPTDLLYYDAEHYDEFILDYEGQSCVVNKRVGYNADGTTYVLSSETTIEYPYPAIELTEGDYTISLLGYEGGYIFARLMVKNLYTDQFATKAQLNSSISQTKQEIELEVSGIYETKQNANSQYSRLDVKTDGISSTVSSVSTRVDGLEESSVSRVIVEYALGDTTTTAPTAGWSTVAPQWQQGKYMWQRTTTQYANGQNVTSTPTCIAGAKGQQGETGQDGQDGQDGAQGIGIKSTTTQYYLSTQIDKQVGGQWSPDEPDWQEGTYIWTRAHIVWTDDTTTDTFPVLASALNSANEKANSAYTLAEGVQSEITQKDSEWTINFNRIEGKADTAQDTIDNYKKQQEDYLKFYKPTPQDDAILEIGNLKDNYFKTQITSNKLAFMEGNKEVSYINGKVLYITTAEILDSLILGNYGFIPNKENGSLSFGKIR